MIGKQNLVPLVAFVTIWSAVIGARPVAAVPGLSLDSLTFEPVAPTELDPIAVTIDGVKPNGCTVGIAHTRVLDEIPIILWQYNTICTLIEQDFSVNDQLEPLYAGQYQVIVCEVESPAYARATTCSTGSAQIETTLDVAVAPAGVGGIAELPLLAATSTSGSGHKPAVLAATAAVVLALCGAWYIWKRLKIAGPETR